MFNHKLTQIFTNPCGVKTFRMAFVKIRVNLWFPQKNGNYALWCAGLCPFEATFSLEINVGKD